MLNIRERFNNMLHSWINYKTLWVNYLYKIEQHDTDLQTIHLANNLPFRFRPMLNFKQG